LVKTAWDTSPTLADARRNQKAGHSSHKAAVSGYFCVICSYPAELSAWQQHSCKDFFIL